MKINLVESMQSTNFAQEVIMRPDPLLKKKMRDWHASNASNCGCHISKIWKNIPQMYRTEFEETFARRAMWADAHDNKAARPSHLQTVIPCKTICIAYIGM